MTYSYLYVADSKKKRRKTKPEGEHIEMPGEEMQQEKTEKRKQDCCLLTEGLTDRIPEGRTK